MQLVDAVPPPAVALPKRRIPLWVRVFGVVVVLAVLAATNLRAAAREHRAARLASDAVAATVVVTAEASTLKPGSVVVTISVDNRGPTLRIRQPRVQAPGFGLEPIGALPQSAPSGATVLLRARLRGSCDSELDVPPRLVVPVVPPSGREHELSAASAPDLAELVCGLPPVSETTDPTVDDVRPAGDSVVFALRLANRTRRVVRLEGLAAEGLQLTVVDGAPVLIAANATTTARVRLTIMSCVHLPTPLDVQRFETLPFAAFEIELSAPGSPPVALPFVTYTDSALYAAVRALAHRTCPGF